MIYRPTEDTAFRRMWSFRVLLRGLPYGAEFTPLEQKWLAGWRGYDVRGEYGKNQIERKLLLRELMRDHTFSL